MSSAAIKTDSPPLGRLLSIKTLDRAVVRLRVGGFMLFMPEPGSFVAHVKLPELGSGEVMSCDKGTMRIRFASGERNFLVQATIEHLLVTQDAPPPPPPAKRPAKAKAKAKATAKTKG